MPAFWIVLGLVGWAALGCGEQHSRKEAGSQAGGPPGAPNVLLITVDTLRPDALGWIGGGDATPVVDRLAASGGSFAAAVAPVPLTLPSHASMFSGLVPRRHGVRDNHQVVGPQPPLLAERLAAAGYATAAVVSGFPLTAGFGLDRGFGTYDDELTAGEGAWLERPALQTASAAIAILDDLAAPWFLWVHFYDPHYPYEPPREFRGTGLRGGYDGEVAYVDAEIGRLLEVAGRGRAGELLTVFAADHGEALGEHGETTHGFFVYDDTMLVPLVFHWPERLSPVVSSEPARLIDLAPTVLDLLGMAPLGEIDGISLVPLLRGEELSVPPAYLETIQPWNSYRWAPLKAVRTGEWKLIVAPRPELFDLAADPDESVNLFDRDRDRARTLQAHLRRMESAPEVSAEAADDEDTLKRLRALGYLGASAESEIPPIDELRDPKDQVEIRELLTEADAILRDEDYARSIGLCRRVLRRDPENRFARLRLGLALRGAGDLDGAAVELERAVGQNPLDPEAHAALAGVLLNRGRLEDGAHHWMEVVRLQPRRASGWSNLGAALGMAGRYERALAAYEHAAELEPGNADRWARLGFAAFAADDLDRAVEALTRGAELAGADFAHAGALGIILLRQGKTERARGWLERSRPTEGDFVEARLALVRLLLDQGADEQARLLLSEGIRFRPELRQLAASNPDLATLLQ